MCYTEEPSRRSYEQLEAEAGKTGIYWAVRSASGKPLSFSRHPLTAPLAFLAARFPHEVIAYLTEGFPQYKSFSHRHGTLLAGLLATPACQSLRVAYLFARRASTKLDASLLVPKSSSLFRFPPVNNYSVNARACHSLCLASTIAAAPSLAISDFIRASLTLESVVSSVAQQQGLQMHAGLPLVAMDRLTKSVEPFMTPGCYSGADRLFETGFLPVVDFLIAPPAPQGRLAAFSLNFLYGESVIKSNNAQTEDNENTPHSAKCARHMPVGYSGIASMHQLGEIVDSLITFSRVAGRKISLLTSLLAECSVGVKVGSSTLMSEACQEKLQVILGAEEGDAAEEGDHFVQSVLAGAQVPALRRAVSALSALRVRIALGLTWLATCKLPRSITHKLAYLPVFVESLSTEEVEILLGAMSSQLESLLGFIEESTTMSSNSEGTKRAQLPEHRLVLQANLSVIASQLLHVVIPVLESRLTNQTGVTTVSLSSVVRLMSNLKSMSVFSSPVFLIAAVQIGCIVSDALGSSLPLSEELRDVVLSLSERAVSVITVSCSAALPSQEPSDSRTASALVSRGDVMEGVLRYDASLYRGVQLFSAKFSKSDVELPTDINALGSQTRHSDFNAATELKCLAYAHVAAVRANLKFVTRDTGVAETETRRFAGMQASLMQLLEEFFGFTSGYALVGGTPNITVCESLHASIITAIVDISAVVPSTLSDIFQKIVSLIPTSLSKGIPETFKTTIEHLAGLLEALFSRHGGAALFKHVITLAAPLDPILRYVIDLSHMNNTSELAYNVVFNCLRALDVFCSTADPPKVQLSQISSFYHRFNNSFKLVPVLLIESLVRVVSVIARVISAAKAEEQRLTTYAEEVSRASSMAAKVRNENLERRRQLTEGGARPAKRAKQTDSVGGCISSESFDLPASLDELCGPERTSPITIASRVMRTVYASNFSQLLLYMVKAVVISSAGDSSVLSLRTTTCRCVGEVFAALTPEDDGDSHVAYTEALKYTLDRLKQLIFFRIQTLSVTKEWIEKFPSGMVRSQEALLTKAKRENHATPELLVFSAQKDLNDLNRLIFEMTPIISKDTTVIHEHFVFLLSSFASVYKPTWIRQDSAYWYRAIKDLMSPSPGMLQRPQALGLSVAAIFQKVAASVPLPAGYMATLNEYSESLHKYEMPAGKNSLNGTAVPSSIPAVFHSCVAAMGPFWRILIDMSESLLRSCKSTDEANEVVKIRTEEAKSQIKSEEPEQPAVEPLPDHRFVSLICVRLFSTVLNGRWAVEGQETLAKGSFVFGVAEVACRAVQVLTYESLQFIGEHWSALSDPAPRSANDDKARKNRDQYRDAVIPRVRYLERLIGERFYTDVFRAILARRITSFTKDTNNFKQYEQMQRQQQQQQQRMPQQQQQQQRQPDPAPRQTLEPLMYWDEVQQPVIRALAPVCFHLYREISEMMSAFLPLVHAFYTMSMVNWTTALIKYAPALLDETVAPAFTESLVRTQMSFCARVASGSAFFGWSHPTQAHPLVISKSASWSVALKKQLQLGIVPAACNPDKFALLFTGRVSDDAKRRKAELAAASTVKTEEGKASEEEMNTTYKDTNNDEDSCAAFAKEVRKLDAIMFSDLTGADVSISSLPDTLPLGASLSDCPLGMIIPPFAPACLQRTMPALPIPPVVTSAGLVGELTPVRLSVLDMKVHEKLKFFSILVKTVTEISGVEQHATNLAASLRLSGLASNQSPDPLDLQKALSRPRAALAGTSGARHAEMMASVAHNIAVYLFDTAVLLALTFKESIGPLGVAPAQDGRVAQYLTPLKVILAAGAAHPMDSIRAACLAQLNEMLPSSVPERIAAVLDAKLWVDLEQDNGSNIHSRGATVMATIVDLIAAAIPSATPLALPPCSPQFAPIVPAMPGVPLNSAASTESLFSDLTGPFGGLPKAALEALAAFHRATSLSSGGWGSPITLEDWLASSAGLRRESTAYASIAFAQLFAALWPSLGDVGRELVLSRAVNMLVTESLVSKVAGGNYVSVNAGAWQSAPLRLSRALLDALLACQDPLPMIPTVSLFVAARSLGMSASILPYLEQRATELPLDGLAFALKQEQKRQASSSTEASSTEEGDSSMDGDSTDSAADSKRNGLDVEELFDEAEETRQLHAALGRTLASLEAEDLSVAVARSRALSDSTEQACAMMLVQDYSSAQVVLEDSLSFLASRVGGAATLEEREEADHMLTAWTASTCRLHQWRVMQLIGTHAVLGPLEVDVAAKASFNHVAGLSLAHRVGLQSVRPFLKGGATALMEYAKEITLMRSDSQEDAIKATETRTQLALEEILKAVARKASGLPSASSSAGSWSQFFVDCQQALELTEQYDLIKTIRSSFSMVAWEALDLHRKQVKHAENGQEAAEVPQRMVQQTTKMFTDFRTRLNLWRSRVPQKWEAFGVWSDLFTQRSVCFDATEVLMKHLTSPIQNISGLDPKVVQERGGRLSVFKPDAIPFLHDKVWTMLRLAIQARRTPGLMGQAASLVAKLQHEDMLSSHAYSLDVPLLVQEAAAVLSHNPDTQALAMSILQTAQPGYVLQRSHDFMSSSLNVRKASLLMRAAASDGATFSTVRGRIQTLSTIGEALQKAQAAAPLCGKAWLEWGVVLEDLLALRRGFEENNSQIPAELERAPNQQQQQSEQHTKDVSSVMALSAANAYLMAVTLMSDKPVVQTLLYRSLRLLSETKEVTDAVQEIPLQRWAAASHTLVRAIQQPSAVRPEVPKWLLKIVGRVVASRPAQFLDGARALRRQALADKMRAGGITAAETLTAAPHLRAPVDLSASDLRAHPTEFVAGADLLWRLVVSAGATSKDGVSLQHLVWQELLNDSLVKALAPSHVETAANLLNETLHAVSRLPANVSMTPGSIPAFTTAMKEVLRLLDLSLGSSTSSSSSSSPLSAGGLFASVAGLTASEQSVSTLAAPPTAPALVSVVAVLLNKGLRETLTNLIKPQTQVGVPELLQTLSLWASRLDNAIQAYAAPTWQLASAGGAADVIASFPLHSLSPSLSGSCLHADLRYNTEPRKFVEWRRSQVLGHRKPHTHHALAGPHPAQLVKLLPVVHLVRRGRSFVRRAGLLTSTGQTVSLALTPSTLGVWDSSEAQLELLQHVNAILANDSVARRKALRISLEGLRVTPVNHCWSLVEETPNATSLLDAAASTQIAHRQVQNVDIAKPLHGNSGSSGHCPEGKFAALLAFIAGKSSQSLSHHHDEEMGAAFQSSLDAGRETSLPDIPFALAAAQALTPPAALLHIMQSRVSPSAGAPLPSLSAPSRATPSSLAAPSGSGVGADHVFALQQHIARQLAVTSALAHVLGADAAAPEDVLVRAGQCTAVIRDASLLPRFMKAALYGGLVAAEDGRAQALDEILATEVVTACPIALPPKASLSHSGSSSSSEEEDETSAVIRTLAPVSSEGVTHHSASQWASASTAGIRLTPNVQALVGGSFGLLGPFPAAMVNSASALTREGRHALATSGLLLTYLRDTLAAARLANKALKDSADALQSAPDSVSLAELMTLVQAHLVAGAPTTSRACSKGPFTVIESRDESIAAARGIFARLHWLSGVATSTPSVDAKITEHPSEEAPVASTVPHDWRISRPEALPGKTWVRYPAAPILFEDGPTSKWANGQLAYAEKLIDRALNPAVLDAQCAAFQPWL